MKFFSYVLVGLLLVSSASAHEWHGHGHGYGHHGGGWVGPFIGGAIVGGILGGAIAPSPYYAPAPYQPYYHWDCDFYGRCAWIWR